MTIQFSTYMFSPRGWPQYGCFCERNIQLLRYADPSTILASTTCPKPDFVLSNRAIIIPRAQSKPPPPKSAARLSGAVGFSFLRPRSDSKPKKKEILVRNYHYTLHNIPEQRKSHLLHNRSLKSCTTYPKLCTQL